MDCDEFRAVLDNSGVDLWTLIDAAIGVATTDHGGELRRRRDGIVERLYSSGSDRLRSRAREDDNNREAKVSVGEKRRVSPATPQSVGGDESDDDEDGGGLDPYGGLFDDEQKKILEIKEQIEESDQSEEALVELLQNLADMDITFQALKETDIGRHVNRLRKHSSSEVKRLVKQLVRKWKDTVDEWVKMNQPGGQTSSALMDGDSPRKVSRNSHHQVPDFAYSPNPHNGSSGSERNNSEPERKPKPVPPRRDAQPKTTSSSVSQSASKLMPQSQNRQREQKDSNFDLDRLASARKRLQANYKEAENGLLFAYSFSWSLLVSLHNGHVLIVGDLVGALIDEAKRQRTIQVMDIHEIPKPKNSYFAKNKGGGSGSVGRHW